jgi:hypothetical protein
MAGAAMPGFRVPKSGGAAKSWLAGRGLAWGLSGRFFRGCALPVGEPVEGVPSTLGEPPTALPVASDTIVSAGTGGKRDRNCGIDVVAVVADVLVLAVLVGLVNSLPLDMAGDVVSAFWRLDGLCARTGLSASPCARFCELRVGNAGGSRRKLADFVGEDGGVLSSSLSFFLRRCALASFTAFDF